MQAMNRIDALMKQEQQAKQKFAKVSSAPNVSEDELKKSYEAVKNVQTALEFEQERWKKIGIQGDKTERRLKILNSRLKQTEELSLTIGVMLYYLSTKIKGFVYSDYYIKSKEKSEKAQIIKAQEEERHRMSRELHDGPAQDIESILLQLSNVETLIDDNLSAAKESIKDLHEQLNDCLSSIKQIIFNLRPLALETFGLSAAIKQLVNSLSDRSILSVEFKVDGKEIALPKYVEMAIFRIVQESLNNVVHHSGTNKAQVRVLYGPSSLSILVQDEGKGFDADENFKLEESTGKKIDLSSVEYYKDAEIANCYYGLLGMRERARIIGAELRILSEKGKGTKVHCKVPYKTEDLANAVEAEKIDKAISRAVSRSNK